MIRKKLNAIYRRLYKKFGPQHWWPAVTPLEVMVGAVLTQNTSWANVERAISRLKKARCLTLSSLHRIKERELARLIRPAGYYNLKARRLKNLVGFLKKGYRGDINRMRRRETCLLRDELLSVNGIGPETADSILLYALGKPVFVVDAYTKRVVGRHRLLKGQDLDYERVQRLFMRHLPCAPGLFNEYHALLVSLGKEFCRKTKPRCSLCPLK